MEAKEKEKVEKVSSAKEKAPKKEVSSQLYERCWSVVNFEACVASGLTYDEAVLEMKKHAKEKASGLCIITDEAAARIDKKQ
jgi:hypothetical protein